MSKRREKKRRQQKPQTFSSGPQCQHTAFGLCQKCQLGPRRFFRFESRKLMPTAH